GGSIFRGKNPPPHVGGYYFLKHTFGIQLTLQTVFGWVNAPFAWLMGVPAKDCLPIGQVLGERIVLNEFLGFLSLTQQNAAWTSAVLSWPLTPCAASPTSAALPYKSGASARWRPIGAVTWRAWA